MSKQGIIVAIEGRVNRSKAPNFSAWRVGLTHDWEQRKKEWGQSESVEYFLAWQADSLSDAQDIESYFINEKGMKGGTGGNLSPKQVVYVYIF